jgi:hypothetical protein
VYARGLGSWLRRVVRKIVETVSRMLPVKRKRIKMYAPVYGDVVRKVQVTIPVKGERDFRKILWLLLEDEDYRT